MPPSAPPHRVQPVRVQPVRVRPVCGTIWPPRARRHFGLAAAAAWAALPLFGGSPPPPLSPPALPTPAQVAAADPHPETFRFALVGDAIINRRLSVYREPEYLELFQRIRSADAAFVNFETLAHDFEHPGAPVSGGTFMGSPPWAIDELKWAGFNLFNVANNHALDFGLAGLLTSLHHLDQAGVAYAGAGENLARARAPGYLDTAKGRVALVACASTFSDLSPAGIQRPDMPGRPGLSPLHFKTTYTMSAAALATLRQLQALDRSGPLATAAATFAVGDPAGVHTEADPVDLRGVLASVRDARRMADWVVVSIHTHEGNPHDREVPPDFLVQFAHAAIDAGADVFVSHGPHVLRGIELYQGKPIFYSLANFVFENDTVRFQPQESYDSVGLPLTALPSDFYEARSRHDTISYPADWEQWESVEAEAVFDARRQLVRIELHPLGLGFGKIRPLRGRPLPADAALGAKILARIGRLSKALGTTVDVRDGVGVIQIK